MSFQCGMADWDGITEDCLIQIGVVNAIAKADPPFDFAQGRLFGDDNQKNNSRSPWDRQSEQLRWYLA